jgi:hypothetical protein
MPGECVRGAILGIRLDPTVGRKIFANDQAGLPKDSVVLCNQIRCVDGARFGKTDGQVSVATMSKVDQALKISPALG